MIYLLAKAIEASEAGELETASELSEPTVTEI
jgi:hypothetical protein